MKPNELLDQFLHQFNNVLAPGAETLGKEVQQKMRAAAQATFDKLDLVTRDEFDAQRAVAARKYRNAARRNRITPRHQV